MSAQEPAGSEGCLFCRIVRGEIPADVVRETATTVAFRDVNPQAPTHVLVVSREHHPNLATLAQKAPEVALDVLTTAGEVAAQEGISEDGYRLVSNTGRQAQQSVPHVHVHVLGGRDMTWPPG
jgi:histidine triad (HIT) family protein